MNHTFRPFEVFRCTCNYLLLFSGPCYGNVNDFDRCWVKYISEVADLDLAAGPVDRRRIRSKHGASSGASTMNSDSGREESTDLLTRTGNVLITARNEKFEDNAIVKRRILQNSNPSSSRQIRSQATPDQITKLHVSIGFSSSNATSFRNHVDMQNFRPTSDRTPVDVLLKTERYGRLLLSR